MELFGLIKDTERVIKSKIMKKSVLSPFLFTIIGSCGILKKGK